MKEIQGRMVLERVIKQKKPKDCNPRALSHSMTHRESIEFRESKAAEINQLTHTFGVDALNIIM